MTKRGKWRVLSLQLVHNMGQPTTTKVVEFIKAIKSGPFGCLTFVSRIAYGDCYTKLKHD